MIVGFVAAAIGIATALSLGQWQMRRAEQKLALQAQRDEVQRAEPLQINGAQLSEVAARLPLKVRMTGRFVHRYTVWLDNRPHEGRAGFHVIAPLELDGGSVVLVNRGWAPRDAQERERLPRIGQPPETMTIEGVAFSAAPRLLELGRPAADTSWPAVWQNLDRDAFERESGLTVARFVVQQTSDIDDRLARNWPAPAAGAERNRGYALQWYSMAALIAVLASIFGLRTWARTTTRTKPAE